MSSPLFSYQTDEPLANADDVAVLLLLEEAAAPLPLPCLEAVAAAAGAAAVLKRGEAPQRLLRLIIEAGTTASTEEEPVVPRLLDMPAGAR